jgi:hypothetical protein
MSVSAASDALPARNSAIASSEKLRTFAVVYGISFALVYLVAEQKNWPLFTFFPATNRVDFLWVASRSGEGPAMYWYGWTALALSGAFLVGLAATVFPERVVRRIPLFLLWLLPTLAFIPLIYSLMPFWTKG